MLSFDTSVSCFTFFIHLLQVSGPGGAAAVGANPFGKGASAAADISWVVNSVEKAKCVDDEEREGGRGEEEKGGGAEEVEGGERKGAMDVCDPVVCSAICVMRCARDACVPWRCISVQKRVASHSS